MEIEDHDIRMKASMNILKANGELIEKKEIDDKGQFTENLIPGDENLLN
jgi:hypothetical protein